MRFRHMLRRGGAGVPWPDTARRFRRLCVPGVLAVVAGLLASMVVIVAGPAQAAPQDMRLATWNMLRSAERWDGVKALAENHHVVALQEAPSAQPAGSRFFRRYGNVWVYRWQPSDRGGVRYVSILRHGALNTAMVTSWVPDEWLEVPGVYRPGLVLVNRQESTVFASIHAESGGGNDAGSLVRRVAQVARQSSQRNWVVLGDFNRDPNDLPELGLPNGSHIYDTGEVTHIAGNELDYMVSNIDTPDWQATRDRGRGSDHWPVLFSRTVGPDGKPTPLTISADNSGRLLEEEGGRTVNGTHVVINGDRGTARQRWLAVPVRSSGGRAGVRIASPESRKCVDVDHGKDSVNGDYLHMWDCGTPTQNWELVRPYDLFPDHVMLRNDYTGRYMNVQNNYTHNGTWLIQWPLQREANGHAVLWEQFHFHLANPDT